MNETTAELAELQDLLDRSAGDRQRHLTDIAGPDRRLSAARLSAELHGVLVLAVATVTRSGEPRVSAVDGHFLHGHWYFGTASTAVKARHLTARPAVSVGYTPRDGYGVWAHGTAVELRGDELARLDAYLSAVYGQPVADLADGVSLFRVDADWMLGYALTDDEQREADAALGEREQRIAAALARLG